MTTLDTYKVSKADDFKDIAITDKQYTVTIPFVGTTYALTIAPDPKHFFGQDDPEDQMRIVLTKVFKHFKSCANIHIVPELTKAGNIHFHGYLNVFDRIKYGRTLKSFTSKIGIIYLKVLNNSIKWYEYIMKDQEVMHAIMDSKLLFMPTDALIHPNMITAFTFDAYLKDYKTKKNLKIQIEDYYINQFECHESPL